MTTIRKGTPVTTDLLIHKAPWPNWFATQDAVRGVLFCNRQGDERFRAEPPPERGRKWAWNLTEEGSGIYYRNG